MTNQTFFVHVLILSNRAGEASLFLIEREPGIVEFPTLVLSPEIANDEVEIVRLIEASTGFQISVGALLDPVSVTAAASTRFVLARLLGGTPQIAGPFVGWEWRPGVSLLTLERIPKSIADELRSFIGQ